MIRESVDRKRLRIFRFYKIGIIFKVNCLIINCVYEGEWPMLNLG